MSFLILFIVIFLILAIIRVPIPFSMGLSAIIVMVYASVNLKNVELAVAQSLDKFTWLAIPAFIFAGDVMAATGISTAIMTFAKAFVGRIRGAAGAVTVVTCLLFGAITGSSLATITGIGGMMLPELDREGYDHQYGTGLISACGFLGILIPPSIPGILYALMSGQNLMKIWLCTVTPGIMLGLLYIVTNYIFYGRKLQKTTESFKITSYIVGIGLATWKSAIALLMPVIIFYGIYGGVFTPTEAGAVAVAYGLLVGWVIVPLTKRQWPTKKFRLLATDAAVTSAAIAMLNVFAAVAGKMITYTEIPRHLTNAMLSLTDSKIIFLLLLNLLLIIVGMFMETNSSILLLGPILIPMAISFGVDPIHFASIMLLNLEIGMITPPFAANIFVGCRVGKTSMDKVLPKMMPFYICCLVVLLVTTYVPQFPLFLPNLTGG
jgi:C4-dicarboxylate transporter DctM subunit